MLATRGCTDDPASDRSEDHTGAAPGVGGAPASEAGETSDGGSTTGGHLDRSGAPGLTEAGAGGDAAWTAGRAPQGGSADAGSSPGGDGGTTPMSGAGGTVTDAGAGGETVSDCVPFVMPSDCPATEPSLPKELRCTGLYGDWERRTYACGVEEFRPAYELWSDGALKRRFIALPEGSAVDASDPDAFQFPVGTQLWKEFWLEQGASRVLGETRLLRKTELGWLYTTYVWSPDGSRAVQTNDGVSDLFGTGHTVPTRDQCRECHSGRHDFVLGWDLVLLGEGAAGLTRDRLAAEGRLTGIDPSLDVSIPGEGDERHALGYLHANCGVSCHNRSKNAAARTSGLFMRLDVHTLSDVHATDTVRGINRSPGPDAILPKGGPFYDFRPLDPERSLVIARMSTREEAAMPRLGTNRVDEAGVALVTAWVLGMTESRGYPAPAP